MHRYNNEYTFNNQIHTYTFTARSEVFAAMFRHDTKENQENRIEIDDFSHEVVTEMIGYIYTGEAPNLSKMAEELIGIAHKYKLERLKKLCEAHIAENLSIENASSTLKLADLYRADELRSMCIEFIKNMLQIMKTPEWKETIAENLNNWFFKEVFYEDNDDKNKPIEP